jgi:phage terminase large subunit GpA-like protein
MQYASVRDVTRFTASVIKAQVQISPSATARANLRTEKGIWDDSLTPMMREPLDMLASRAYTGVIFVGPARTGKTFGLILGGMTYAVMVSPGDMLITQMSQDTARDFSLTDLDRAIRNSPGLRDNLSPRARDDNTYDKVFRSGMRVKIGWPSIAQLSSKTLKYVVLTDYDRPENRDNVDGEGPFYDLAAKRIETYMSRGKALAESSPDSEYLDPAWKPKTPHEGPPSRGIMELYNRGTRARWYWPCQHCGDFFQAEPGLRNFALPPEAELHDLVQHEDLLVLAERFAKVVCPHCGGLHDQMQRSAMSARGAWVHEGEQVGKSGEITGSRRGTQIVSYHLGGVAAAFQSWQSILLKYMQALAGFIRTGDESALKFTVNTDQGAAYLPQVAKKRRSTDDLKKRLESWPKGKVPDGVRFLTAAVDVQSNRFVVHVMGWGVRLESWLVDRFVITASNRPEGASRFAGLDPAAYQEDWDTLTELVLNRTYQHATVNIKMPIRVVGCDSGGKAGVTGKAYEYWRSLRRRHKHFRFKLLKGASKLTSPTATMTFPNAQDRADRTTGGRGDVPVWLINTNILKDMVIGDIAREQAGPGYVHLPRWLEDDEGFFKELDAETRTDKGWKNLLRARNEAFDLHAYNRALCKIIRADRMNWDRPVSWAKDPAIIASEAKHVEIIAQQAGDEHDPPPTAPEAHESTTAAKPVSRTGSWKQTRRKGWASNW